MSAEWESLLNLSMAHFEKGKVERKTASKYLWMGARAAIKAWVPNSDPTGMILYRQVLIALGGTRKTSASKIKTVALANLHLGLDLDAYGSLGAAYESAQRLAFNEITDLDPVTCPTCGHHK